mmetsp:Transcript_35266/g.43129  ORF Transcript_35266/g.43129 Transcript_35266/m.43129 type:complete len:331 (+) Transcript_35266:183-1175(+)
MRFTNTLAAALLIAASSAADAATDEQYLRRFNAYEPRLGEYSGNEATEIKATRGSRGGLKTPRRRGPAKDVAAVRPKINPNREDGKYHDWRDYDADVYGGKDPYAECVYPQDTEQLDTPDYQALSAICKDELIWTKVLQDTRRERFYTGYEFTSLFDQDMNLTYDVVTDTMPKDRLKKTHPVGTMSKIEVIPHPDQPYTGMFKGVKHGMMRISDTTKTTPTVQKTNPGFGIKFLRDGMTSANILAMFHFDGQSSWNFFKNRWTTILREPNNECARRTIGKHLATVTDHIGGTSVMEVAEYDQYGNKEAEPHWPFQIEFEAYDVYGWTDEY